MHVDLAKVPAAFLHALGKFWSVVDNAGFYHFAQQVVALAGTLTDASKDRHAGIFLGNIVDKFLNKYGFSYARTTEKANLAALEERLDEVDDLDASEEHLLAGGKILKLGRVLVNTIAFLIGGVGHAIDGLADDVKKATVDVFAHRHGDRSTQGDHLGATLQAVGAVHGDGAHGVFANILLAFKHYLGAIWTHHHKGIVNVGEGDIVIKSNIDHSADDLGDFSFDRFFHVCQFFLFK